MNHPKLSFNMMPDIIIPFPKEVEKLIRDFWPATRHIGDFENTFVNGYCCFYCGFRLRQKMIDTRIPILENYICGSTDYYTCGPDCHEKAEPIQYYFFYPADMDPFEKLMNAVDCFYGAISYEEFDEWRDIICLNDIYQNYDYDEYHDNILNDDENDDNDDNDHDYNDVPSDHLTI